jgi:hypothetical protein
LGGCGAAEVFVFEAVLSPRSELKGDSYRLKDHDLGARPAPKSLETA